MTPNATISISVSNQYRDPSYSSEIITQGILGEGVEVLEQRPSFMRVRQADGYESWISSEQIVLEKPSVDSAILVKSHFLRIYAEPTTSSEGIKEAVFGSTLNAVDETKHWYQIALPDGSFGWAEKGDFGTIPEYSTHNIITLAKKFLGYQYSWGRLHTQRF